jgi:hypothetical protein
VARSRYEQLQQLARLYGEETVSFRRKVNELGPRIVDAYDHFLDGPKGSAIAVPPDGDFDVRCDYRGEAYDCHGRGLIYLETIRMGVCTLIKNLSDDGASCVRTLVQFTPSDGGLLLKIGVAERQFRIPEDEVGDLSDVIDAIFRDATAAFSLELEDAQGKPKVGFLSQVRPSKKGAGE